MNVFSSECSSGCESGWTLYLEQSFLNSPNATRDNNNSINNTKFVVDGFFEKGKLTKEKEDIEEEEEDLSMVSDASSGPPHFNEDHHIEGYNFKYDNRYFCSSVKDSTLVNKSGNGRHKMKEHGYCQDQLPSFLDDTASSPAFNFSKNNYGVTSTNQASMEGVMDYPQNISTNHFEGRSAFQDRQFSYIQPSLSGNQLHNNQWF